MNATSTLRTCSNCSNWTGYKQTVDSVLAAQCGAQVVVSKKLTAEPKITKGSDSCSVWKRKP